MTRTVVVTATPEERERAAGARLFIHRTAHPRGDLDERCVLCQPDALLVLAIRVLDERPRDARAARLVLHDAVCMSGCTGRWADEHARTQAKQVAALRKFLAGATLPG